MKSMMNFDNFNRRFDELRQAEGDNKREIALSILRDAERLEPDDRGRVEEALAATIGWKIPQREEKKALPPFPVDALPETFRMFAEALSKSLSVDPAMTSVLMLSVLSAALSGKYVVHPGSSQFENLNLYTLIIADPSERKSPIFKQVVAPLFAWERRENERRAPEIADFDAKRGVLIGAIKGLQKKAESPKNTPADRDYIAQELSQAQQELDGVKTVHKKILTCNDSTPEAVGALLAQQGERLAILSDEGGIFGEIAGRYSKSSTDPNMDIFLQGYDGGAVRVFRMSREPLLLEHPLLTFGLMAQPKVLEHVLSNDDFSGRGFLARFLICRPPSQVGHRPCVCDEPDIPESAREAWQTNIDALLDIEMPEKPACLELSSAAKDALREFNDWVEGRLPDEPDDMKSWLGKLIGNVLRITGLLHVWRYADDSEKEQISSDTLIQAISIGEYFYSQQEHLYAQEDSEDDEDDLHYIISRLKRTVYPCLIAS